MAGVGEGACSHSSLAPVAVACNHNPGCAVLYCAVLCGVMVGTGFYVCLIRMGARVFGSPPPPLSLSLCRAFGRSTLRTTTTTVACSVSCCKGQICWL